MNLLLSAYYNKHLFDMMSVIFFLPGKLRCSGLVLFLISGEAIPLLMKDFGTTFGIYFMGFFLFVF